MIKWTKDNFRNEINEFERITKEFIGNDPLELQPNLRYLERLYDQARPRILRDLLWRRVQNTGSFNIRSFDDIFRNLRSDGVRRNVSNIATQFIGEGRVNDFNGSVHCPIILYAPNNKGSEYNLVAGNTRLSMAKALDIQPKVIILETDW